MLRAQLPIDTQEIEGMNSILQCMSDRAPFLKLPLASDRMQIKKASRITPDDCVCLHHAVVAKQQETTYLHRFEKLEDGVLNQLAQTADDHDPCPHEAGPLQVLAIRFALGAARDLDVDVGKVWTVGQENVPDFVICWKYGKRLWLALGETHD
eukprot:9470029-Pyramimonas_sp.AAC.1